MEITAMPYKMFSGCQRKQPEAQIYSQKNIRAESVFRRYCLAFFAHKREMTWPMFIHIEDES